jgi:hypothetical protein
VQIIFHKARLYKPFLQRKRQGIKRWYDEFQVGSAAARDGSRMRMERR